MKQTSPGNFSLAKTDEGDFTLAETLKESPVPLFPTLKLPKFMYDVIWFLTIGNKDPAPESLA